MSAAPSLLAVVHLTLAATWLGSMVYSLGIVRSPWPGTRPPLSDRFAVPSGQTGNEPQPLAGNHPLHVLVEFQLLPS